MKSKILIVIVLATLLLSACQPAQTSTPSEATQPVSTGEATSAEAPQPADVTAEPPKATLPLTASREPMNGCRVTGSSLQPNPTLVALFPAVTENDWVKGPSDARVTILEFSDFQ